MPRVPERSNPGAGADSPVRGSNQRTLRAHNERLILTLLRVKGPKPKAEIARMTGMSPQTASVIMRSLEADGLIERCAPVRGRIGQPSIPLRLAADGAYFLGLKVGRRSADVVLVDFVGRIVAQAHATYPYPEPDGIVGFVADAAPRLAEELPCELRGRIVGLGIALPSYMWEWSEIIGVPARRMAVWRERDVFSEIGERFDFPVYCQNDASCACAAELVFGDQDRPADFLHLFIGYFVGGGVVLDNRLVTGPTGNAGAIGPLPVPGRGRAHRQLVEVASLSSLEAMILESGGRAGALWESSSVWEVDARTTRRWLRQTGDALAQAIASACAIIDFEHVVVDGWMPGEMRRELVELIATRYEKLDLRGLTHPEIREGSIGPNARSIGAASLPLSHRFLIARGAA